MSDPRMAPRRGVPTGSKFLKVKDKFTNESTSFERHWESHYTHLIRNNMLNMSEQKFRDKLIAMVNVPETRERVTQGLLYGLLTEPDHTSKYFMYLGEIATDNWYSTLCNMNMIIFEFFYKISDLVKSQIFQFFRYAIKANVAKLDNVIMNLIRYGGDGSDFKSRLVMMKTVVEMLSEKEGKEWIQNMKGMSMLMPTILNVVIRMAVDMQHIPGSESTRTLFLNFAFFVVSRRLQCCLWLGRDLLLLLMRVSRTSQFSALWKDLLRNPIQFGGAFKNVQDLLNRPPHAQVISMRLSIPIARQVDFMLGQLKYGGHEKHLEWFTQWNLRAQDSASLRADIIRYALASNQQKEVNPDMRATLAYAMLTGTTPTPGPEMQWAKLVTWWDWFGYAVGEHPNGIENALLVVRFAINTQPATAQTLLEFAMKLISRLHPTLTPFFRSSFNNAQKAIQDRLGPTAVTYVLENARLDATIRELCKTELSGKPAVPIAGGSNDRRGASLPVKSRQPPPSAAAVLKAATPPPPAAAAAAEKKVAPAATKTIGGGMKKKEGEKIEKNGEKKKEKKVDEKGLKEKKKREEERAVRDENEKKEIEDTLKGLKGELKNLANDMATVFRDDKTDDGEKSSAVQRVMEYVQENEELHEDDTQLEKIGHLIGCLVRPLVPIEGTNLLPDNKPIDRLENKALAESCFSSPIFTVFRSLSLADSRGAVESIISWMREKDNAVTYLLLFFLKVFCDDSNLPAALYENVATHFESTLDSRITEDLDLMARDDRRLFTFVLPFVFKSFEIVASGCIGLYRTFCKFADNDILTQFLGAVYREDIVLFRRDSFNPIVNDSLEWEGIPELFFWQLIHADGVSAEWFHQFYTKINSIKNSVAASQLLILLKRQEPNTSLLRAIFMRPLSNEDHFTTSALKLMIEDEECCHKTAELVATLLKKQLSSGEILLSSVNSKNAKKTNKLSMEHIMYHLTVLSDRCMVKEKRMTEQLLSAQSLRDILSQTRKSDKSSVLYSKYERLFSTVELLDEQKSSSRSLRGNRSGSSRGTKREATPVEEETTKKKKKPNVYTIDSDSD